MDPSSPNAMQRLVHMKGRFDIACVCDTGHDRHGIVTPGARLGRQLVEMPVRFKGFAGGSKEARSALPAKSVQAHHSCAVTGRPGRPTRTASRLRCSGPRSLHERIESILSHAPGNGEHRGGIKVNTTSGWCAAWRFGTENIYKIDAHLCGRRSVEAPIFPALPA